MKYACKRLHILLIAPRTPPEAPSRTSKLGVAKGSQAFQIAPNARQRPHSPQYSADAPSDARKRDETLPDA